MLIHSFSVSASLHWLPTGEPALSRISLSIRYQNETKTCWKAVAQQWLVCSKDLNHIFSSDPVPKLPSARQFPTCHLQEKGERCLAFVFSGDLTGFSNFRETKAKCFQGPNLKCTHRLKQSSHTRLITASAQSYCHVLPGLLASYTGDPKFCRYFQIQGKKFSLDYTISKVPSAIKQEQRFQSHWCSARRSSLP